MGLETALLASLALTTATTAASVASSTKQAKAEQAALYEQEVENNKIAAAEASDAAIQADKKMAEALAAMEAIGGFGSYNDDRLQLEMAGLKGLDLARIESNRARTAAKMQAARKAIGRNAVNNKIKGAGKIAGSVLGAYGMKDVSLAVAEQGKSQIDMTAGTSLYD